MTEPARLTLLTPLLTEADAFAPRLGEACAAGPVAAVIARLAPADERTLIKRVKALAPAAQEHGAALVIAAEGELDLPLIAARGGADGIHVAAGHAGALRERLKDRILGVGGLRSKHDAMAAGESGADYLLFGEPRPDGSLPPLDAIVERAAWWAEIFQTPCIGFVPALDAVARMAETGAEFVGLGDAVWEHPEGPAAAVRAALAAIGAPRP